jgi:hypothetical protein
MSSRLLRATDIPELQPTVELRALADGAARYPFVATNRADAEAWQVACGAAVARTVGFLDSPRVDPASELIEEVDRGDFVRRKIVITTAPHARMPVYLLIPKAGPRPLPVAVAYAGHGYGVKDIVGLWEDGEERIAPDGYHKDFGVAVLSPWPIEDSRKIPLPHEHRIRKTRRAVSRLTARSSRGPARQSV